MSPWEIIGWAIAIPMALFTALFVLAIVVAIFKAAAKGAKATPNARVTRLHRPDDAA